MAPMIHDAQRIIASSIAGRSRPGRHRQVHRDPQGAQTVHALQLVQLQLFHGSHHVTRGRQVVEVRAILLGLHGLGVHDGDPAGLGHPLARAPDHRLVDALLDDLVAHVVGAVDVEALLVEAEANGQGRVVGQDQVRGLQGQGQAPPEDLGLPGDTAGDQELPEPEVAEVQLVVGLTVDQGGAHVDAVVHAVGALLLEVVREHGLGHLLLGIEVGGDRLVDGRHALLVVLALPVDRAHLRIQGGPVRLHALAHGGAEVRDVLEERLHVLAEEGEDAHLVAGVEVGLDVGDLLVDAVVQLVEDGQTLGLARSLHDLAGQAEVGAQVGLDGHVALGRRAADVAGPVQGIDVPEHDGLDLRHGPVRPALDGVEHGLAEAPLDRGVDGRALLLDDRLHPRLQLLQAAPHGHGEERQHLAELERGEGIEVARVRRGHLQEADDGILVVERGQHDVAHAGPEETVLDGPALRIGLEVLDEEGRSLGHDALEDAAREVAAPQVGGVREDAAVLQTITVLDHEDPFALEGGQGQAQVGTPEERPQLELQPLEARAGGDRLLLDEIALEARTAPPGRWCRWPSRPRSRGR